MKGQLGERFQKDFVNIRFGSDFRNLLPTTWEFKNRNIYP